MHRLNSFILRIYCIISIVIMTVGNAKASPDPQQPKCPEYVNPTGSEFPILAYAPFNAPSRISKENFKTLREAGFNISLTQVGDTSIMNMILRAAEGTGVKVMVNCTASKDPKRMSWVIPYYRDNPNVMGYFITDEPRSESFDKWRILRDIIFTYDTIHLPYINLLPGGIKNAVEYEKYVRDFVDVIDLPMISYDHYPIIQKNGKIQIKDGFFKNLEIVSEVSKETGRPFWAFCMSSKHLNYPEPQTAHLLFEAFNALAYGAQGINYYKYGCAPEDSTGYKISPIDNHGHKTSVWDRVRDVNRQIHALSHVFLNSNVVGVWHNGETIPQGTTRLKRLPAPFRSIKTGKQGVLVSHLENNGKDYLVIVNHDIEKSQPVSLSVKGKVARIMSDGSQRPFSSSRFSLDPGGYAIFSFN